jgi:hypothetical protein
MRLIITSVWCAVFAMVGLGFYMMATEPHPTPTIQAKPACHTKPGLPIDVLVCPNKHAYHIEGGRWVDMGRWQPWSPTVPRG